MKPDYTHKLVLAKKELKKASSSLISGENSRRTYKKIWQAYGKTLRAWLVKNGQDWNYGYSQETIEAKFNTLAPKNLTKKFSLLASKCWSLSKNLPYSPHIFDPRNLSEKERIVETQICINEVLSLVEHVESGAPLNLFKGEMTQTYPIGQWINYISLGTTRENERFWEKCSGRILGFEDGNAIIIWNNRTIDLTGCYGSYLEPTGPPAGKSHHPLKPRRIWFDLHPEYRQNPLFITNKGAYNHSQFYTCPCCEYPMLNIHPLHSHPDYDEEPEAYEICRLCDWADPFCDDFDDSNKIEGVANFDYSLSEARDNFEQYSSIFRPGHEPFFSVNMSSCILDLKQRLRSSFDQMINEDSPWKIYLLWHEAQNIINELKIKLQKEEEKYSIYRMTDRDAEGFLEGRVFSYKWKWQNTYELGEWCAHNIYDKSILVWVGSSYYGNSYITRTGSKKGRGLVNSNVGGVTSRSSCLYDLISKPIEDQTTSRALRRNWFDLHEAQSKEKFTCPCCGFPTLDKITVSETCFLCDWIDTGQDDYEASEVEEGINGNYSLIEARQNFEHHLCAMGPDHRTMMEEQNSTLDRKKIKLRIQDLFYQILGSIVSEEIDGLWEVVLVLREELKPIPKP